MLIVLFTMLVIVTAPCAVYAQQRPDAPEPVGMRRPYRGLFGGPQDPSRPQSLVLTAAVYGAYDDNVLAGLTNSLARNWRLQRSGYYGAAHTGLQYAMSRNLGRVSLDGQSGARVAYYRREDDAQLSSYYQGRLGMGTRLSRSLTFSASQRVAYAPSYSASLVPVDGGLSEDAFDDVVDSVDLPLDAMDPDLELFHVDTFRAYTTAGLSQRFGRHTTLGGRYQYRYVDFRQPEDEESRVRDYTSHSASVGIAHERRLSAHSALNLGYGIRATDRNSPAGQPRVLHTINAGVSYSRALSFSRRTSVSFGTGSIIARREPLAGSDGSSRMLAHLTGNAHLVHELGRTWSAQLSYQRGMVFREDFADQFYFMDRVSASIGGLVSRRLSVAAGGMYGTSTRDRPGASRYYRMAAMGQATYGLTSYLGLFARYIYYELDYGDVGGLDSRLPRKLNRQGVRVGLTTSIPLLR
jgi:hypothetical protein